MKSERILTAIITVCGLFLLIYASNFEAPISYDPVGPKAFPILLMGLITAVQRISLFDQPLCLSPWNWDGQNI